MLAVFFSMAPLVAQQPVINPQGVVNAASFATDPHYGLVVVHGEIATILGQNLAASEESATEVPLPTSLAGTSVTVVEYLPHYSTFRPDRSISRSRPQILDQLERFLSW
jgi:hypothetical protein